MNDEPCSCFNQWLEQQPNKEFYEQLSEKELHRIVNAWNAGWHEGWKKLEYWIKKNANAV